MADSVSNNYSLGYLGVTSFTPPNFVSVDRAPTPDDYYNYNVGTLWLDITGADQIPAVIPKMNDLYILVKLYRKVAKWVPFTGGKLRFLTGDNGLLIASDQNRNINTLGTANRITVAGNPGTNTLTWDIGSSVALTFNTDVGSATTAANMITFAGGTLIDTVGSGSTLTINLDSAIPITYTTDNGVALPSGSNLDVLGGVGIDTSGAGSTVTIDMTGIVPKQYTTDSGVAVPAAGNLNVIGDGVSISTSGAGSTVAIDSVTGKSAFMVGLDQNEVNVTGDGNAFTIGFDRPLFNIGSDLDLSVGRYTAPQDGIYIFQTAVTLSGAVAPSTASRIAFRNQTANEVWEAVDNDIVTIQELTNGFWTFNASISLALDAGDIMGVVVRVESGPKTVSVESGSPTFPLSWFSGSLIADL